MNNLIAVCLAIFSVCCVLGGIILIILDIRDERKMKPPVWFHSLDVRDEVERIGKEEE